MLCTGWGVQIAKYHNASLRLTVSSMATQAVLGHICGHPPGAAHAGVGAIRPMNE